MCENCDDFNFEDDDQYEDNSCHLNCVENNQYKDFEDDDWDDEEYEDVPVSSVKMDHTCIVLYECQSRHLSFTSFPQYATHYQTSWSSSNCDVAEVDGGKVIAKSTGFSKITVSIDGVTASCVVTVLGAELE